MWTTAEHFAGYEQQDAHEFLIAALSAIDAGLSQPRRSPTSAWDWSALQSGLQNELHMLAKLPAHPNVVTLRGHLLGDGVLCLRLPPPLERTDPRTKPC